MLEIYVIIKGMNPKARLTADRQALETLFRSPAFVRPGRTTVAYAPKLQSPTCQSPAVAGRRHAE